MASIELQVKAIRTGKRLKRPTAKVRKAAVSDTGIIIEVTGPDGSGLLIAVDTERDHSGLRIRPYRADSNVFVQMAKHHEEHCALLAHPSIADAHCDCGAEYRYRAESFEWVHTSNTPAESPGNAPPDEFEKVSP